MGPEDEIRFEDIAEIASRDALHEGHPEDFTHAELKELLKAPEQVEQNEHYRPLKRLQAIWETEIDPLPEGAEKEELKTLYDNRVQEAFASEIINLPETDEVENPHYKPVARLAAIGTAIRDFPFARAEAMEKMYEVLDQKKVELGVDKLYEADGVTEV